MPLKLVKGINTTPPQLAAGKSREQYLLACLRDELQDPKFTPWERDFIASLAHQVQHGRKLSDKQKQILERIWNK
jgi:hypothetical protein